MGSDGRARGVEVPSSVAGLQRAGFWMRLVAAGLDLFVVLIPFAVFASLYSVYTGQWYAFQTLNMNTPPADVREKLGADFLFVCLCAFAVCGWLYFAIAESSKWRATWGKHLLGLYVTDESGARVNFWKATARFARAAPRAGTDDRFLLFFGGLLLGGLCEGQARYSRQDFWLRGCAGDRAGGG